MTVPKQQEKKRPIRGMALLIAALIVGAIVLIVLWMRNPPPGVKPATGAAAGEVRAEG